MRLASSLAVAALLALPLVSSCGVEDVTGDQDVRGGKGVSSSTYAAEDQSLQLADGTFNSAVCDNEEKQALVSSAIESGDYLAWVEAITADGRTPKVLDKINEENFDQFAEAYRLAKLGDIEAADAIRLELGLRKLEDRGANKGQRGKGNGKGKGYHGGR